MSIAVRMPDLGLWRAQVRCQAGCPVATDAGRYVQLIAEGRDEDAVHTGALLAIEGAAAFGAASLAFLRFTGGPARGAGILAVSVLLWTAVPAWLAMRHIGRTDI